MNFNSWRDYENFEKDIKYNNRFIHSPEAMGFLSNIANTLQDRKRILVAGRTLFRSQIGYIESKVEGQLGISGFPPDRMKPIQGIACEGRANPKGISYLYLSDDRNTSLAELRPHVGQYISLADFHIAKDLKLVDCYSVKSHYSFARCIFDEPISQIEIAYAIWSMINEAFTKPVSNTDSSSEYVVTQILAELFKSEGYDGICFKSGLGAGHNFILFDLEAAELIGCKVMDTKSVSYDFNECTERYFGAYKK